MSRTATVSYYKSTNEQEKLDCNWYPKQQIKEIIRLKLITTHSLRRYCEDENCDQDKAQH